MVTGRGGDKKFPVATITATGPDLQPSSRAARGGAGAVMGSKRLKAIVIDPRGAPQRLPDARGFADAVERLVEAAGRPSPHTPKPAGGCTPTCAVPCSRKSIRKETSPRRRHEAFAFIAQHDPELADRFMETCDDMGLDALEIAPTVAAFSPANSPPWEEILDAIRKRHPTGIIICNPFLDIPQFPNRPHIQALAPKKKSLEDCLNDLCLDELGLCSKPYRRLLHTPGGLICVADTLSAMQHRYVCAKDILDMTISTYKFEEFYENALLIMA
jgi:hypothetical protein